MRAAGDIERVIDCDGVNELQNDTDIDGSFFAFVGAVDNGVLECFLAKEATGWRVTQYVARTDDDRSTLRWLADQNLCNRIAWGNEVVGKHIELIGNAIANNGETIVLEIASGTIAWIRAVICSCVMGGGGWLAMNSASQPLTTSTPPQVLIAVPEMMPAETAAYGSSLLLRASQRTTFICLSVSLVFTVNLRVAPHVFYSVKREFD